MYLWYAQKSGKSDLVGLPAFLYEVVSLRQCGAGMCCVILTLYCIVERLEGN